MEKYIRVNGIEIQKGLCTVAFNIWSEYGNKAITHNDLYKLLDTATDVKEINEEDNSKFVSFKQGIVQFEVYTMGG